MLSGQQPGLTAPNRVVERIHLTDRMVGGAACRGLDRRREHGFVRHQTQRRNVADGSVASSSFSDTETKKLSDRRSRSVRISFMVLGLWKTVGGWDNAGTALRPVYIKLESTSGTLIDLPMPGVYSRHPTQKVKKLRDGSPLKYECFSQSGLLRPAANCPVSPKGFLRCPALPS